MPAHDLQHEQYQQCLDLFKEEKYTECIELCLHNLTDPNLPRHLKIKTLIVASNATGSQDESIRGWQNAENHRLSAERLFRTTKELVLRQAPQMSEAQRAAEEAFMKELRGDLDRLLEWQADDAPKALIERSIREGLFPPREGVMMDTLYTRQYLADDEDVEMEDDDDIPLEITEDVHEAELQVFGSEQGIVDYLKGVSLEDKVEENKSTENASDENVVDENVVGENKSEGEKPMDDKPDDEKKPVEKKSEEKKPVTADGGKGKKNNTLEVASPMKKKQSTANLNPNTPSQGSGLSKKKSTASLIPRPHWR